MPQINAKVGTSSASVISYPDTDQKDIVLVSSRAKTALQVASVEWVTSSASSKIKLQVIKCIGNINIRKCYDFDFVYLNVAKNDILHIGL